jgi:hypothetical protein
VAVVRDVSSEEPSARALAHTVIEVAARGDERFQAGGETPHRELRVDGVDDEALVVAADVAVGARRYQRSGLHGVERPGKPVDGSPGRCAAAAVGLRADEGNGDASASRVLPGLDGGGDIVSGERGVLVEGQDRVGECGVGAGVEGSVHAGVEGIGHAGVRLADEADAGPVGERVDDIKAGGGAVVDDDHAGDLRRHLLDESGEPLVRVVCRDDRNHPRLCPSSRLTLL